MFLLVRPLHHPALEDISVEGILHALSDPVRAAIFMEIASADCARTCSAFSRMGERTVAKSTLSHHFKVLREAGLVGVRSEGTSLMNYLEHDAVERKFPGLLTGVLGASVKPGRRRT